MSEPNTETENFDVFLCHNTEDKPAIRDIKRKLAENGITPWLDEEQIRPGTSWQTVIGDQIDCIKSAAVFIGESGLGPWQDQEIQALLSQFVNRKCPVIPVVLPNAKETPDLPWTLQNLHWVDFRAANPDPLKQFIWGITGEKPDKSNKLDDQPKDSSLSDSDIPHGTDLFPPKEKKVIELRLSAGLDEFTDEAKMVLLDSLNKLMNIGEVKLTKVAAGSVRLYLELDPEDADKLYSADKEGRLVDLGVSEARLYPAIAEPPEEDQRAQLLILLDRVNEYWIDGVLKHSLYNEVLISLGKRAMDEAVEPPWKHFVELPSQRRHLILQDRSINNVFDATGLLLILGEPGSGKTTTLLDLASELIAPAKKDPKERVPIVLNLSSWKKKQTLDEWIVKELSAKYRVPVKIGRSWLKNDYLLPMLDGLDEVQNALRPDCVAAINDFIEQFEPSGLVVCCRLMEYQWLPERLKLNGAICLESLGIDEVNEFLNSAGSQLVGLQNAIKVDPVLRELSRTPLMLSIMSLAFEDISGDDLDKQKAGSYEETRTQILKLYVDRMFQHKELKDSRLSKDRVIGWLALLAKRMKEHSQSVFMVEGLQPSWLNTRGQRVAYGTLTALSIAFIFGLTEGLEVGLTEGLNVGLIEGLNVGLIEGLNFGLIILIGIGLGCWSESPLKRGFISALSGGLIAGLIAGLSEGLGFSLAVGLTYGLIVGLIGWVGVGSLRVISTVETIRWQWKQFWRKAIQRFTIVLSFWLILGLIAGLIFWLGDRLSFGLTLGLTLGLLFGLSSGLIVGIFSGLLSGMTDTVRVEKASPNQGISLSMKNTVFSILIIGLIVGLIGGLIIGLLFWQSVEQRPSFFLNFGVSDGLSFGLSEGLIFWLEIGLLVGLIGGLNRGGSAVVKHYSLRIIFWVKGYTPFKFIKFLDHCAKLILLKKIGGGYMFIHRILLEHFAEMEVKSTKVKKSK